MTNDELDAIRARDAACAVPKAPIEAVQWAQSNADRRALLAAYDALRSQLAKVERERDAYRDAATARDTNEDSLRSRLAEAERDSQRLDWLERHLFEGRWDGTIGRPKSWHMAGPYRHTLQRMRGDALREAIDLAMRADSARENERE